MTIDVQKLWGVPVSPDTVTIAVRHTCGHVERYPFEGIEASDGYHMPSAEAARLAALRTTPCVLCEEVTQ
jgi:hypothetical protein